MALASMSVNIISRGKGRSAVAAAAYRSATKLYSEYDKKTYDYTRKQGVVYTEIFAPSGAPVWCSEEQLLWNYAEGAEPRKDARLAREVMMALPCELSRDQNIELARAYAQTFTAQGMVADLAVHDIDTRNPHAHIMVTDRPLDGEGFSKKKNRDWNSNERLVEWRKKYEELTNQYLELYGHEERIDIRSYAERGLDQIPTIHLGHYAHSLEQIGKEIDRGNINRDIHKANIEIAEINREIDLLKHESEYIKSIEGLAGYPEEKEQDEPFQYDMAAEHSRKYNIPDDIVFPHSMGADEGQTGIGEPLSGSPVEHLIEHYTRMLQEVRKTSETVGIVLTERGKQSLEIQRRNIEYALEQFRQQQEQKLKEPPAPVYHSDAPSLEEGKKPGIVDIHTGSLQRAEYVKSLEGASGYSVEKEPVEIFHHDRAAEHIREYNIQDAAIAPHYMGAEEEQVEIEEPLSDIPVEDLIEHYNRAFEDVKKTAETVGIILTEKGKQSLAIQQKNIENSLEQLKQQQEEKLKGQLTRGGGYLADQQRSVDEASQPLKPSAPEREAPDRPSPVGEPEPQRRPDFDEVYEVPDTQTRQPAPPHTAAGDSQEPHRASEEQTKMPQQHEYDARYETPEDWYIRKAKEQETPFHHAPTRKTDRQAEYDNLYRNPGGGSTNQRSHHPDPDDPDPKK